MEKSNQLPKTESCSTEGEPVDLKFHRNERRLRSVLRERREPQAGPASGLSNSASKESNANGDGVVMSASETNSTAKVRTRRVCRGLRAWRARKETHGTKEARRVPAALNARAKQEGRRNDKKCLLTLRESDRFVVSSRKAQVWKLEKGPTEQRSPHRQPVP